MPGGVCDERPRWSEFLARAALRDRKVETFVGIADCSIGGSCSRFKLFVRRRPVGEAFVSGNEVRGAGVHGCNEGFIDSGSNAAWPHHQADDQADRKPDPHINNAPFARLQGRSGNDAVEHDDEHRERPLADGQ